MRVSRKIEKKTIVNFTETHLVYKNKVRMCVVMLW